MLSPARERTPNTLHHDHGYMIAQELRECGIIALVWKRAFLTMSPLEREIPSMPPAEKQLNTTPHPTQSTTLSRPPWMKARVPAGPAYAELTQLMRDLHLHTVCEEARCPNIGECWNARTATFLLLGDICTRNCRFCAIRKGKPAPLDAQEPQRIAHAVATLQLAHVVLTSVTRDDLPDGGAQVFVESIRSIRDIHPKCTIEVLIPDFAGNWDALQLVLDAQPEVVNHNVETVPRLAPHLRPQAPFARSLGLLRRASEMRPECITKSGLMVGVGETNDEVLEVMDLLRAAGVQVITIGQYLAPTRAHWPVARYVTPEDFAFFAREAKQRGFRHVESSPLVRSSYHAHRHRMAL